MAKQQQTIHLGYLVGGAESIRIPLGHMAVTGQTQQAGKTTALESLAHRSGRAVIAFVTKRGEGAFGAAPGHSVRALQPYFRERADWQFVEAVLEATMRERMKYERQWIMKVSRGATTLGDVRANTQHALDSARGEFMKSTYEKLLAYLDIVVPQIGKIRWAPKIVPADCLNVMDLSAMTMELQSLVIAATLDYVLHFLTDTTVIVPEAWEFIPRGRKSPVTLSAEAYVRKGATLGNYLWIDSQDLAGVHTPILKSTHVFLLGVQREHNEIKRTIAHLHGPAKPKPEAIARLGLGQFIACYGSVAVTAYVEPWWMTTLQAIDAAKGLPVLMVPPPRIGPIITGITGPGEDDEMDMQLKADNEKLRREVAALQQRVQQLLDQQAMPDEGGKRPGLPGDGQWGSTYGAKEAAPAGLPASTVPLPGMQPTLDQFYQYVRTRLQTDEQVMAVVARIKTTQPKLVVDVAPRTLSIDGASLKGRIGRLIQQGFFDEPKRAAEAQKALQRTGGQIHPANLGRALNDFVLDGFITREGQEYQRAVDLQVTLNVLTAV